MAEDDDRPAPPPLLRHFRPFVSSTPAGLAAGPRLAVAPREEPAEQPSIAERIEAERAEARSLWAELEGVHPVRRGLRVRNERRFHTWGFFDLLLRTSKESVPREPGPALTLARLALSVLDQIAPEVSDQVAGEYRASALAVLADAARTAGHVELAEETLRETADLLRSGSRDPSTTAQVHAARGRLAADVGRLGEAAEAFGRAARLLERLGNVNDAARLRVEQAGAIGPSAPDQAVRLIERAWPHLDFAQDSGLELVAHHRLIWSTNDAGRSWVAARLLERAQPLYERQGTSLVRMRRRWLEGRILRDCGEQEPARRVLLRAYHAFAEIGHPLDFILCGLDLLEFYRLLRNDRQAERLLADIASDLARWDLPPEAIALWRQAQGISGRLEFARLALAFRESWYSFTADLGPEL